MEKTEIIFAAILVIFYIISSIVLKLPIIAHVMVGIILLIVLAFALILKMHAKYENEKIRRIFRALALISLALYAITLGFEILNNKPLFIDSGIFLVLLFATEITSWIFKRRID